MRLIDLTIPWGSEIEPVPNNPRIFYVPINHHELQGYSTAYATFSIHTGTHIDAPYHFIKDGLTMEQVPLEWLNGPAVLLDLRAAARPGQPLAVETLRAAAGALFSGRVGRRHTGPIPPSTRTTRTCRTRPRSGWSTLARARWPLTSRSTGDRQKPWAVHDTPSTSSHSEPMCA